MSDVTRILLAMEHGDHTAAEQLLPLVYQELRRLAAAKLGNEKLGQTLQPTALVHEAYLRLVGGGHPQRWNGRGHFFGAAAEAMRRILIENARRRDSLKRAHTVEEMDVAELPGEPSTGDGNLLALDEALSQFERDWPEKAKLVKLRYFAGLSTPEAAQALGISIRTAERTWTYAKAWLLHAMRNSH